MKDFRKKTIFLVLLFFTVLFVTIWLDARKPEQSLSSSVMENATLPVIRMDYEGERINLLHGYTTEMEAAYMHEAITPLPEGRNLQIYVTAYGNQVTGAEYEIWSSGMDRLVEQTQAQVKEDGESYTVSCPLQNLLEKGREYVMILKLSTARHPQIYYYTRLWYGERQHEEEMLRFARDFSDKTFHKEEAQSLVPYLESNSTGNNESLGNVNIHSSFAQITWGNLAPVREEEPELTITEMNDTYASYVFRYPVSVLGTDGGSERYQVKECFTIRWSEVRCYLMSYDRTMNQEFPASMNFVEADYLDLGIQSAGSIQVQKSPNGNFSFFALGGNLWSYHSSGCQLTNVFSFAEAKDDGVRTDYQEHDIRVVHVDDEGNAEFLVFGYMNRGVHEGEAGLAFYQYTQKDKELREVFYLPSSRPYQVMKNELGQFFYISSNRLLYWMYRNGIYAIDFTGSEFLAVVEEIKEDQLVLSGNNSAIAWQNGEDSLHGNEIQVLYLSDGETRTITASEGERIRALGFLGEDFVYGIAREGDISADPYTTMPFPMYALVIVGKDGQVQNRYQYEGIYIVATQVVENRINLERAGRDASGQLVKISSDTLIQNTGETKQEENPLYTAKDREKQAVYRLKISSDGKNRSISLDSVKKISCDSSNMLRLNYGQSVSDSRYYAYAKGGLQGIYYQISDAVASVSADMGTVTDGSGKLVWGRFTRPAQKEIAFTEYLKATDSKDALRACLQMMINMGGGKGKAAELLTQTSDPYEVLAIAMENRAVDCRGLTVSQLLSCYLSQGIPVLGILDDGTPVLIVGYDVFNITLYHPVQGTTYKVGQDTAAGLFAVRGNIFISYVK